MPLIKEFKEFAVKGSVLDLAVGVIIGGAFGKIVSSLVADVLTPLLGFLVAGINVKNLNWTLLDTPNGSPKIILNYGLFIQNIIDFIIIALSIFILIKAANSLQRKRGAGFGVQAPEPAPTRQEELLIEIRDLLKK